MRTQDQKEAAARRLIATLSDRLWLAELPILPLPLKDAKPTRWHIAQFVRQARRELREARS